MQFSESWLRTFVDPTLSTSALAELLTMSGLEVEQVAPVAAPFTGVVVGKILSVAPHPNADKLQVCEVDAGGGATLRIVCGAPNVAVGLKVPCAKEGARLPRPTPEKFLEIGVATMRGVQSQGMLCSARELGLSEDQSGLLVLHTEAPAGCDLREALDLDDHIFVVKLTPNRADCLSMLGIAREVAALAQTALRAPAIVSAASSIADTFPISIQATQGCGRFTGRVIRGVRADAATPDWMRQRLERSGQRSISALVDVTNYVMLELGRPLHVYDLGKLRGGINVRNARLGETLKLLNEQTVTLDEDLLVIADDSGPIGLAGIMGGDGTKADLDSRDVFLEAAFFYPEAIAGRSRRLNFSSDAAHRFERGVDFENNRDGIERATALILEICGGSAGPLTDVVAKLPARPPVRMRTARVQKVLGIAVSADQIGEIFTRMRLSFSRSSTEDGDVFLVQVPTYRFDLQIEEDLIEEVARVFGYDNIPAKPPVASCVTLEQPECRLSLHALRDRWVDAGYQEVINYSFVEPGWELDFAGNAAPIRLLNPIASQLAVMRSTLMGGLVANVRYNLNRKIDRVRVFECGRVFQRDASVEEGSLAVAGIRQPMHFAAAIYGAAEEEQWGVASRGVDFFDLKGDLEALLAPKHVQFLAASHPALHPGRSAQIRLEGRLLGWIGEIHPKWRAKYEIPGPMLLCELEAEALQELILPRYSEVSKFPPVRRDIAVTVDEAISLQTLMDRLLSTKAPQVDNVSLFDLYRGKGIENGKKGLAFRVLLQDTQKTLTDAEVEAALDGLRNILVREFDAKLRQ
ncbi:MAG: phenylalanine--tRNA ligase subunit beta [Burkholderiales bacterium]